jgi:hypothetical protein
LTGADCAQTLRVTPVGAGLERRIVRKRCAAPGGGRNSCAHTGRGSSTLGVPAAPMAALTNCSSVPKLGRNLLVRRAQPKN